MELGLEGQEADGFPGSRRARKLRERKLREPQTYRAAKVLVDLGCRAPQREGGALCGPNRLQAQPCPKQVVNPSQPQAPPR